MPSQLPLTANNPDKASLLTPDEFRELAVRIRLIAWRIQSFGRAAIGANLMIISAGFLLWGWHNAYAVRTSLFALILVNALTSGLIEYSVRKEKQEVERLARFLESTQDVSQLGIIIDLYDTTGSLGEKWQKVHMAAGTAVTRLLHLLQTEDTDVLNTQQRAGLRRRMFHPGYILLLGDWLSPANSLPVLSALEQIGDKRDLPDVERLLKYDTLKDEVRAAAERCAQTIRERLANENARDFLLRADRKPEAVETLLRPSSEKADTPPQQLLRAATSDAPDPPV
jgi:hypothetical protein